MLGQNTSGMQQQRPQLSAFQRNAPVHTAYACVLVCVCVNACVCFVCLTLTCVSALSVTEGAYNLVKLEDIQLLEGISLQQHRLGPRTWLRLSSLLRCAVLRYGASCFSRQSLPTAAAAAAAAVTTTTDVPAVAVCRDGAVPVAVQDTVYQYNHQCGTLHLPFSNPGTRPVALAEITAHNRVFPELSQV